MVDNKSMKFICYFDEIEERPDREYINKMLNDEFHSYSLDYSEFQSSSIFVESEPIERIITKLRTMSHDSNNENIIITARTDLDDQKLFLQKFLDHKINIDKIHVYRAGNRPHLPTPQAKVSYILPYIQQFTHIRMFDDQIDNLRVFLNLNIVFPAVEFSAFLVHENGSITTYK